ncbi:RING finger protein 37 isoform X1 [Astyanax mexicanus]|uniref:RING finger protein 37 isoform X1 n=1 Tax=Astyanax mexicanus TaxID=7994 RepID=A0A8T2LMK3_ASTMX|nr:RING finger protein 37 isoform X1 [Astyanax mexicanus]
MVVNLCLPHFQTTAHCNKRSSSLCSSFSQLCADGYDVSNLLACDPSARRRGFKLEYFLRPPLHVTLHFRVRVELCRVDVELWPCGMDQGSVSRKLEILTCSDPVSEISKGSQEDSRQFKLVGRCELREDVLACFNHRNFKHRIPFLEAPPELPVQAKQQELWSRGLESLNSVAQLRISIPFGGAGSALGIKSLAVWGVPARSCPSEELAKVQKAHFDSLKVKIRPPSISPVSYLSTSDKSSRPNPAPSETPIPDEFLDPLTQELMVLPLILPSGMVIDSSTLEEYQKHEATWGRLPNDPFTGVPFTQDSKPLPNPVLKSRIDSLILQTGCTRVGSRNGQLNNPHTSKLVDPPHAERPTCSKDLVCIGNLQAGPSETGIQQSQSAGIESETKLQKDIYVNKNKTHNGFTDSKLKGTKRKCESNLPTRTNWTPPYSSPLTKMPKMDASLTSLTDSSQTSHEQRLSDSLDQALSSALQGLPTYTSQSKLKPETTSGPSRCGSCSCSLTVYSASSPAYSLPCGHLLCRTCLRNVHRPGSQRLPITCPTCKTSASPSTITRVHH